MVIDPNVPVPQWGLSERGRTRTMAFRSSDALKATRSIYSSGETKAIETAEILAPAIGVSYTIRERTHENDRSATGFLAPDEFETVANQFFATPEKSVRGWERAVDAQTRIVEETAEIVRDAPPGDILMIGHGGVGTLLYCYLRGLKIDRLYDQPAGGGNVFAFDLEAEIALHPWCPMEAI